MRVSTGQSGNVEDMVNFIMENNIGIMAPYLANNFDPDSLYELIVSWCSEDYEDWKLALDPEWQDETKAESIDLNGSGDPDDEIYVSDEYAEENPTIVHGAFDLETENYELGKSEKVVSFAVQNHLNSAQCAQMMSVCLF